MANFNGTAGNDSITGTADIDVIRAGGGNDTIYGGLSADNIRGDAGNDVIFGEAGNDIIDGNDGDDVIDGGAGGDTIDPGSGNNIVFWRAGGGNDSMSLRKGSNILYLEGWAGGAVVNGATSGAWSVELTSGGTPIAYFTRSDAGTSVRLTVDDWGAGTNIRVISTIPTTGPTTGDDTLFAYPSGSTIDGLSGNDSIDGGVGADRLYGSAGNDTITGDGGNDTIDGGADNDVINGGAGADYIAGNTGNDVINGGAGDDIIYGSEGDDHIIWRAGGGSDDVNLGAGSNIVDLEGWAGGAVTDGATSGAWRVALTTGGIATFTRIDGAGSVKVNDWGDLGANTRVISNIPTAGDDTLIAYPSGSAIDGLAGNDSIIGGVSNDTLIGGIGNDTIMGGSGNDTIDAGAGNDTIIWTPGDGNDTITLGAGNNTIDFGDNADTCVDSGNQRVFTIGGATITITDWTTGTNSVVFYNHPPAVTSSGNASVDENATGTVYTASGSDPDAGTTLTYVLGGADAGLFDIDAATGAVSFKAAPDFEVPGDVGANNVYDVTVTAFDGVLTSVARAVAITVTDVNEAPSVTSGGAVSFAENAAGVVYTASGSDPDAGTRLTYVLGGADAGLFDIDAATGAVSFKAAPDFEAPGDVGANNVYDVTVTASDGALTSLAKAVAITVTDVNEAIDLSSFNGISGFWLDGRSAGDQSGISDASAGDVNGDGFADIIIGAYLAGPNGTFSGASYVVFGGSSGFAASVNLADLDGTNGFRLDGVAADDYSGYSVASAGDVNSDGFADLIIGAPQADPNGSNSGASYVVFGKASGWASSLNLASLNGSNGFRLNGGSAGDKSGLFAASAGDLNGDGYADMIVGGRYADPNGNDPGASYVVFGKADWAATPAINLSTLNGSSGFRLNGVSTADHTGSPVASAGDMNGDGLPDLIIGAQADKPATDSGSSAVYLSQATAGATYRGSTLADTLRGTAFGDSMNGYAGDDTMNGGAGNDIITGGAGDDLAQLSGAQSNYRFGVRDGVVITSGADGQDHFTAIERFKWGAAADISIASLAASGVNLGLVYSRLGNRDFDYSLPDVYTGPLAGIVNQQINGDTNDIVIATIHADFCNAGAGDDGMDGGGGNDILDGGLGSNFITGGAGLDRFFIDGWAAATAITWSTITDFSPGEQVTIWGYQPGVSKFVWVTSDGMEGFQGATLHCDLDGNGLIDTSLSFTGLSQAQLATPSYGSVDGKDYIFFS